MTDQQRLRAALDDPLPTAPAGLAASARRRVARRRAALTVVVAAALAVGALALLPTDTDRPDTLAGPNGASGAQPAWEVLPAAPLTARHDAVLVAVQDEVLVLGGSSGDTCPPGADCSGPTEDERLDDAAAYDVQTKTWRRLSTLPAPLSEFDLVQSAVVDGTVYVLTARPRAVLWAYDVAGDSWKAAPMPPSRFPRITAVGPRLVAVTSEGADPVGVLEPGAERWISLPEDPLGAAFDRQVLELPEGVVLAGRRFPPDASSPGSGSNPAFTSFVRLDLEARSWGPDVVTVSDCLPDGLRAVGGQLVATGELVVNGGGPAPGDYGRPYATGGFIDPSTGACAALPTRPQTAPTPYGGGWYATGRRYVADGSVVLDTLRRTWLVPGPAPVEVVEHASSAWVDDRLFVWGGGRNSASTYAPSVPDSVDPGEVPARSGDVGAYARTEDLVDTGAIWTPGTSGVPVVEEGEPITLPHNAWRPGDIPDLALLTGPLSVESGCVVVRQPGSGKVTDLTWPQGWTARLKTDGVEIRRGDGSIAVPAGAELSAGGGFDAVTGCATGQGAFSIQDDLR